MSVPPTSREMTLPSHLSRVILLRRLRQALPLCERWCRCGRLIDAFGHHRAACAQAVEGVSRWRASWPGSAGKRKGECAPMSWSETWTFHNLTFTTAEGWRWWWTDCHCGEVLNWLDTTMVCALHRDGRPRRGAADHDGVALTAARRKKERTHPELLALGANPACVEVGIRWSHETRSFFSQLARARARGECPLMRRRAEQAWRMRWGAMFACAAVRAVASSLLDDMQSHGGDGRCPAPHVG